LATESPAADEPLVRRVDLDAADGAIPTVALRKGRHE